MAERRVAIAGGGTAGHVFAGLEILRAYRERGAQGFFLGSAGGYESRLLGAVGERLVIIPGRAFARQGLSGRMAALASTLPGVWAARRVLARERVELVIGVGGYASLGAGLAARSLGIPLVLHEANALPGLANRILAPWAQAICTGFPRVFSRRQARQTGTPARWVTAARASGPPHRFLVLGGSEGSPFLNRAAPELFGRLRAQGAEFMVHHITGHQPADPVKAAYAAAGVPARVDPFLHDLSAAYAEATFAVACPGALVLAELALAGLPALLVPLGSAANDHQTANVRAFGAAPWVSEAEWRTESVAEVVAALLEDTARLAALRAAMAAAAKPEAPRAVVEVCEAVLGAR